MKNITVYDYDDERIQQICDRYDLREAEVIELILDEIEGSEDSIFR